MLRLHGDQGLRRVVWRADHLIRRINKWLTFIWMGPGLIVSFMLMDSVPWVVGMSWYAIVVSHLAAWRADEPTNMDGGA